MTEQNTLSISELQQQANKRNPGTERFRSLDVYP